MNDKQPEALRLANNLERMVLSTPWDRAAAAELRRLHTVNQQWEEKATTWLASPEAAARLDGYRDLAQQLNDALMQKDALIEALRHARSFIKNGVELGYIRMPDADCPDSAHNTLPAIEAALAKVRGEKDGTR